jgi:hypothetical protein
MQFNRWTDLLTGYVKMVALRTKIRVTQRLATSYTNSKSLKKPEVRASIVMVKEGEGSIGAPIILGRCPSLSAHESESMLRTLSRLQRETRERERQTSKRHVGEAHSVLTTAILLPQRLSC